MDTDACKVYLDQKLISPVHVMISGEAVYWVAVVGAAFRPKWVQYSCASWE